MNKNIYGVYFEKKKNLIYEIPQLFNYEELSFPLKNFIIIIIIF